MSLVDDSVLDQFDFDGVLDTGSPHIKDAVPYPDFSDAIARLEDASARGDLSTIRNIQAELRRSAGGDFRVVQPGISLHLAIQNSHKDVITYLLAEGAPVGMDHVHLATLKKDTAILELFLEDGWGINQQLEWSVAPALSLAVEDANLTAWFLAHGADPNAQCLLDITPLSAAVLRGPLAVIKMLFDHGGSIEFGQLLHFAAWRNLEDNLEVLFYILSKGPPINDVMYQHRLDCYWRRKAFGLGTALHYAAADGNLAVVQALLENVAHPLIKDSLGQTPLQRAEKYGHAEVVRLLRPIVDRTSPPLHQFTDEWTPGAQI